MCTERKATGLFVVTSFLCDNAQYLNKSIYVVVRLNPGILLCFATGPGFNPQRRQLFSFLFFLSFSLKMLVYILLQALRFI